MPSITTFFKNWYVKLRDFDTKKIPLLSDAVQIQKHIRKSSRNFLGIEPIPRPHEKDEFIGVLQDVHTKACFYYFKSKIGGNYKPIPEGYYDFVHIQLVLPNTAEGFYKVNGKINWDAPDNPVFEEVGLQEIEGAVLAAANNGNYIDIQRYNGYFALSIKNTPSGDPNNHELEHAPRDGGGSDYGCGTKSSNSYLIQASRKRNKKRAISSPPSVLDNFIELIFTDRSFYYIPFVMETGYCVYYKFSCDKKDSLQNLIKNTYGVDQMYKVGFNSLVKMDPRGFYYTEDLFFYKK